MAIVLLAAPALATATNSTARIPITQKVSIGGAEVYSQDAGHELLNVCSHFPQEVVKDTAQPQIKVCGTQTKEQEAIDKLTAVLSKAEELPGHYLVEEVHTARGYLDMLGPIPAVRKQLRAAMMDGREAFKTTSLYRVKEAMVWLHVAVNKGMRFKLDEPVPTAKKMLDRLGNLKDALIDLKSASFQGNVSFATQSNVPEAVVRLRGAIAAATAAGLESKMPIASDLLKKLEVLEAAVVATANATAMETATAAAATAAATSAAAKAEMLLSSVARHLSFWQLTRVVITVTTCWQVQHPHFLELESTRDSQSRPSYKPSPVVAHADWMNHWRLRTVCRPNFSVISAAVMEFGRSCLFAKTRSAASRISSSFKIFESSSRASSTRSRSLLSTT